MRPLDSPDRFVPRYSSSTVKSPPSPSQNARIDRLQAIFRYLLRAEESIRSTALNAENANEDERFACWMATSEYAIFSEWTLDELDVFIEKLPELVRLQLSILEEARQAAFLLLFKRREARPLPSAVSKSFDPLLKKEVEAVATALLADGGPEGRVVWVKGEKEEEGGQATMFQGVMIPRPPDLSAPSAASPTPVSSSSASPGLAASSAAEMQNGVPPSADAPSGASGGTGGGSLGVAVHRQHPRWQLRAIRLAWSIERSLKATQHSVEVLGGLVHPHLMRTLGFCVDLLDSFTVSEWIIGGDLFSSLLPYQAKLASHIASYMTRHRISLIPDATDSSTNLVKQQQKVKASPTGDTAELLSGGEEEDGQRDGKGVFQERMRKAIAKRKQRRKTFACFHCGRTGSDDEEVDDEEPPVFPRQQIPKREGETEEETAQREKDRQREEARQKRREEDKEKLREAAPIRNTLKPQRNFRWQLGRKSRPSHGLPRFENFPPLFFLEDPMSSAYSNFNVAGPAPEREKDKESHPPRRGFKGAFSSRGPGGKRCLVDFRDLRQRLDLCMQLSRVVTYLHEKGVGHFDLSLKNVMLDTERRRLVLIDMGSACRVNGDGDVEKIHSQFAYTRAYIHPQKMIGGHWNVRDDVHALLLLCSEILGGPDAALWKVLPPVFPYPFPLDVEGIPCGIASWLREALEIPVDKSNHYEKPTASEVMKAMEVTFETVALPSRASSSVLSILRRPFMHPPVQQQSQQQLGNPTERPERLPTGGRDPNASPLMEREEEELESDHFQKISKEPQATNIMRKSSANSIASLPSLRSTQQILRVPSANRPEMQWEESEEDHGRHSSPNTNAVTLQDRKPLSSKNAEPRLAPMKPPPRIAINGGADSRKQSPVASPHPGSPSGVFPEAFSGS
uniref:Protein kinase domain-containing protein n=1 Tax=Chromera velia CCMP2878 TaxID=1169474 RepID=A0A0G4HPL3_9ALVE|eukprot:Cvel_7797.t1-p1 / transcript=Cvel_7797.t1 / gene=Cvel_7797 / organism=Chromera_velia_CCMP2878 / gene_product=hypothetical protein / transcript_product=hypothetical protein / location=Cvel_scaffold415:83788-89913(-) / protein_length=907 / sequence_SO=supercontig / SO=protein_coding / is_pseudo=false